MLMPADKGASYGGGDMPHDEEQVAKELIKHFERELEYLVNKDNIPRRYIRPLLPGSVFCGSCSGLIFVGYLPELGIPHITFLKLKSTGQPNATSYYEFLMDETGQDFCVVELQAKWIDLPDEEMKRTLTSVALELVSSELSRTKVNTAMIPFNPIFGQNTYPVRDDLVFVLMPFEDSLTAIYNNIVKPTIESKGLLPRRADDITSNNAIIADIWRSICEARFVIADLTQRNPNVMYELGIAHTIGKETILISQETPGRKYPFDISHMRIISYAYTATGGSQLRNMLDATVNSVIHKLSGRTDFYINSP